MKENGRSAWVKSRGMNLYLSFYPLHDILGGEL